MILKYLENIRIKNGSRANCLFCLLDLTLCWNFFCNPLVDFIFYSLFVCLDDLQVLGVCYDLLLYDTKHSWPRWKGLEDDLRSLMFYHRVHKLHQLQQALESHHPEFNDIGKAPMSLVLFCLAIKHISLQHPSGHALLVVMDRSEPWATTEEGRT